jgi:hypothetical protein
LNNRDFIIDQNNRCYNISHNLAALVHHLVWSETRERFCMVVDVREATMEHG